MDPRESVPSEQRRCRARPGRLTTLAIGSVGHPVVTVDARPHAAALGRLLGEFTGQMARVASGTHVLCSIDRLLAGLAAADGDHDEADRLFAAALSQEEALRSGPLVARTKQWWGRALARPGDARRAAPLLAARSSAEQFGMRAVVAQIDDLTATDLFASHPSFEATGAPMEDSPAPSTATKESR